MERIPEGPCWLWQGGIEPQGYGRVFRNGKRLKAHRLVYEALREPIPEGHHLHHLCENKHCVNPWHCTPLTPRDHFNGHRSPEWYTKRQTKPIPDHVREIRDLHASGAYSLSELAKLVGRSKQYVSRIVLHQRYPDGRDPQYYVRPVYWNEIPRLYATGAYSQQQLAEKFAISQSMVSQVIRKSRH